ncbi:MAG: EAL domain-containing protein, partial [Gammaproteobacteria bacterium]|nr:EAL domain-containing protein [Gammaproteobacteria bacterium]
AIYLIDDEPELLGMLSGAVKQAGLNAQGFTQASRFFEQIKVFEDDSILVLDLHMPEMDGIQVMRRLAQMAAPPALILISGQDIGVLRAAEKLGQAHNLEILASIPKPVPIERFRQLIEQHASDDREKRQSDVQLARRDITPDELRQAIHGDQLVLHYQPQLEIATNTLTGIEALARWQHPEQGLIYPDRFIPLAAQHG